jgi:chromosome segregation ATPase
VTDKTTIETKLASANARLQAATGALPEITSTVEKLQAQVDRLAIELRKDPRAPQEVHQEHAGAKNQLYRRREELARKRAEIQAAQRKVTRLQTLLGGEDALEAARKLWREKSVEQVNAVKAAESARENLARLDALLADEMAKTEAAQQAQRSAILARLGFSNKPASEVSAMESVLVGAAANVDALRAARPDLEVAVAQADAHVATCDQATRKAEQDILNVKQVIAEGTALLALETCRVAVDAYHVATIAARGNFGERLSLYPQEDTSLQQQHQADRLKARAMVGE